MKKTRNVDQYKRELDCFSDEVQEWLIDIFLEHGNCINRLIVNSLKYCPEYFIAIGDEDYMSIANGIFEGLIKRFPYLSDETDMMFELFKQAHKKFSYWIEEEIQICESFDTWVDETKEKYGVELMQFADVYHSWWYKNENLWERKSKVWKKKDDMYEYDWRLAKNPFGLDEFYEKYKRLPFIGGYKHNLEMLLVYMDCTGYWTTWQKLALKEYIGKFRDKGITVDYKEATARELGIRWEYLISENQGDDRWKTWKDGVINGNVNGTMQTFIARVDGEIVGEVTFIFENSEVNALRVNPEYQGHGVASGLLKYLEDWARENKIESLIIGVEPNEVRNMQMYFHWGFTEFVSAKGNVLYYRKRLV